MERKHYSWLVVILAVAVVLAAAQLQLVERTVAGQLVDALVRLLGAPLPSGL